MEKATTVAVIRPASPSQMLLPKIPGMYMKPMSWSIRGVPRTIQTKVLHSQRRGVSRLMEPKAITSPKGSYYIDNFLMFFFLFFFKKAKKITKRTRFVINLVSIFSSFEEFGQLLLKQQPYNFLYRLHHHIHHVNTFLK